MKKTYIFYIALMILAAISVNLALNHYRNIIHGDFSVITSDGSRIPNMTPFSSLSPDLPEDLEMEFQPPTEQWFHDYKYAVPFNSRYGRPGETVSMAFAHILKNQDRENVNEKIQIRFSLTERDRKWQLVDTVKEQTFYLVQIPVDFVFRGTLLKNEEARYILSAEIIGENGIEDTRVNAIYVPTQEVNATFTLDKKEYSTSETLTLTIFNEGPTVVRINRDFKIEPVYPALTVMQIQEVELDTEWAFEQYIPLRTFPRGEYRIKKTIRGVGTDIKEELVESFRVVN